MLQQAHLVQLLQQWRQPFSVTWQVQLSVQFECVPPESWFGLTTGIVRLAAQLT